MEAEDPDQPAPAAEPLPASAAGGGEGAAAEMNPDDMELASFLDAWDEADPEFGNELAAAIAAEMGTGQEQEGQAPDEQAEATQEEQQQVQAGATEEGAAAPTAEGDGAAGYEDVEEGDDQLMQDDTQTEAGAGPAAGEDEAEEGEGGQAQQLADAAAAGQAGRDAEAARREQRIMASMTDAQLDRYEAFRRSSLTRPKMKKLLQQLLGTAAISDKTVIALCGIGKMFVGDIIEMARHLSAVEGHTGPLLPRHVQRAYQVLDAADKVPHAPGAKRRMFR